MATERKSLLSEYYKKLQKELEGRRGEFLYRGQKYAEWKLQSGAVNRIDEEPIQSEMLIKYHKALLESVRLRGWDRDFNGRRLKDLELLAKLQHYGAATCLLDFTTRFDIALWFACQEVGKQEAKEKDEDKPKKGRIFIVAIEQYMQSGLGKVNSNKLKKPISYFLRPVLKKQERDGNAWELRRREDRIRFWYWEPETLMGRMLSQESRFLFGPQDIPKGLYFHIDIEEEHKEDLLIELGRQQGLRPETVFSDIHGFADINARGKPLKIKSYEDYMRSGMNKLKERGELTGAIEDFDEAIKLRPDSENVWFYSGVAKRRVGRYEEAIKSFDEAIKLDAYDAVTWYHRGMAKMELERYEEAVADYDEAIKLDADFAYAWIDRGVAKMELKRYEEAIADHDEAIKLDAYDAVAWHCRGSAKMELKRYEDAIADYDEAIKLAANFAVTRFERGSAKMKLGYYEAARSDMEEALVLFRKRENWGWQERVKKCIKKLDELLEKKDKSSDS